MAGLDVFESFIKDYFRARPWMLEADGSFKISSLDMDPDNPAEWGDATITTDDKKPKTPADYAAGGRMWLELAEWEVLENKSPDRAAPLAILAVASAFLGICAQFIRDREVD